MKPIVPLVPDNPISRAAAFMALNTLLEGKVTQGTQTRAFEEDFRTKVGAADAVFVNSGSSANLLAFAALRLKPGSEVIVSALTWPTTVWPIVQYGCIPVFVDVDPETLVVTQETYEQGLSKKTAAYFTTHILGNPAYLPMSPVTVIEDCCEAQGTRINGRHVGTFGRFGTFSFHVSHHITTIEGGMIVSGENLPIARSLRSHGWVREDGFAYKCYLRSKYPDIDQRFLFVEHGYNLRGDEVRASIGRVNLIHEEEWAERRVNICGAWTCALSDAFQPVLFDLEVVPFAFPLVLRDGNIGKLKEALNFRGIEHRPILAGNLTRQPAMSGVRHRIAGSLRGVDFLHRNGLYISCHPSLTDAQIDYLADFLENYRC